MEQYYYNHMNKAQQAAYHSILSGVKNLADEFQIPALEGEELQYLFDKKKICEHQKAMTARVEKLIRPAQKLSEWEKEKYVHDFICENIRYDKLKKSYSHEIIGPLGQGVGVCEGIAKAVKVLLDALGVWCVIAICGNNPETSEIRYDYFNLDDSQIFRDHEPLIAPVPHCGDYEHFYYKEKKLSFDVQKKLLEADGIEVVNGTVDLKKYGLTQRDDKL